MMTHLVEVPLGGGRELERGYRRIALGDYGALLPPVRDALQGLYGAAHFARLLGRRSFLVVDGGS